MGTVLLTGAASGIGRATARRLASQGHRCVLVDRDSEGLAALRVTLPPCEAGDHLERVIDLTNAQQIDALAGDVPTLDALINNAGMTDSSNEATVDQTPGNWQLLLDLNLHAPARLLRALAGSLTAGARIVNVASGAGLRAIPWRGAYSPSKAGLIAQTRAAAHAYPEYRFTVLCPGLVRTELVDRLIADKRLDPARAVAKIPLGRMANPDDIACALAFLASDRAISLAGNLIAVDGGSSVFGGSQAYLPNPVMPFNSDAALAMTVRGHWPGLANTPTTDGYPAVVDATVLHSAPGQRLAATLAAARQFRIMGPSSLTVLLPQNAGANWEHAGDAGATRMLIASLACEWGPSARRINAMEIAPGARPEALNPMLRFIGGAQAQYVTGQTLFVDDAPRSF